MGSINYFDKSLPTVAYEAAKIKNPERQVEIFTTGGKLFLRISAVNPKIPGDKCYTVQLSKTDAEGIISGITDGMVFLSMK